jgi:hypothetical protein
MGGRDGMGREGKGRGRKGRKGKGKEGGRRAGREGSLPRPMHWERMINMLSQLCILVSSIDFFLLLFIKHFYLCQAIGNCLHLTV